MRACPVGVFAISVRAGSEGGGPFGPSRRSAAPYGRFEPAHRGQVVAMDTQQVGYVELAARRGSPPSR